MEEWNIILEEKVIGVAKLYKINQPWFECKFYPTQHYENVKHLFEEELRILDTGDCDYWNNYYDIIDSKGLKIINLLNHQTIERLILHIQSDTAWFRY